MKVLPNTYCLSGNTYGLSSDSHEQQSKHKKPVPCMKMSVMPQGAHTICLCGLSVVMLMLASYT